jgi:ABC-type nitrate/sulfonate/bicarbonate transport system substrate-binding protein
VLWISGPKGELPSEHVPVSSANLQVMRAFAEEHPDLVHRLAKVFSDLSGALEQDPERVKSAVIKLYPSLDAATLDLLFSAESQAWKVRPVTASDMAREVAYVKSIGTVPSQIDRIDPASMLFP